MVKDKQQTVWQILKNMAVLFKPPSEETVSDILDEHLYVGDGSKYDTSFTPYIREPLNFFKDRNTTMIVYVSPARTGKTLGLIVGGFAYVAMESPSDVFIAHITESTARKFSKLTISRVMRNTPKLRNLEPLKRAGNNILLKLLRNGMYLAIGHTAPSQLAGTDYRYAFATDTDRSPQDNGEGSWISQLRKRTQTFGSSGLCVIESSPRFDVDDVDWVKSTPHEAPPTEGITQWYLNGDRRMEYWTCEHCSELFLLYPDQEVSLFALPDKEELIKELMESDVLDVVNKYAFVVCPHCGGLHDETRKSSLTANATWRKEFPDAPNNVQKSYWATGYSATYQTWTGLLTNYFNALKTYENSADETPLRTFFNLDLGTPYTPLSRSSKITVKELLEHRGNWGEKVVPDGVRLLIANVDVQKYKWVVDIQGIGLNDERWVIDRFDVKYSERENDTGKFDFVQPATYPEDWTILIDEVIHKRYPLSDGSDREMSIHHTVCDMHGLDGVTENAYKFVGKLQDLRMDNKFKLLRGERPSPTTNTPLIRIDAIDKSSGSAVRAGMAGKLSVLRVNTTLGKDIVSAQLQRDEKGGNYIHFAQHIPESILEECTVETRTAKGWEKKSGRRNEQLDLLVYGLANLKFLYRQLIGKKMNWEQPPVWATDWDTNINVYNKGDVAKNRDDIAESERQRIIDYRNSRR